LPFLFLTSYSDKETLQRAKAVNPSGYIVKPFNEKTLLASQEIEIHNHAAACHGNMTFLLDEKDKQQAALIMRQRDFSFYKISCW